MRITEIICLDGFKFYYLFSYQEIIYYHMFKNN